MTNITREQIEYCIKTNSSTEDERRQICALALRALDTPSVELIEAKAYERVATIAKEQAFFCSQQAYDCPVSRRSSWLEASKTLDGFATAIRALSPSTIRYVELPEGYVVVPVEPTENNWGNDLVRLIMVWCEGPKITPSKLIEMASWRNMKLPQWLLEEKEMDALDHTVSKGTRATLIYRAMIGEVK